MAEGLRRFLPFASGAPAAADRPHVPSREERDARAERLAEDHPDAAGALAFYRRVLELQEPLAGHRKLRSWLDRVAARPGEDDPPGGDGPALRLERLPAAELRDDFLGFVEELAPAATSVLAPIGRRLVEAARSGPGRSGGSLFGRSGGFGSTAPERPDLAVRTLEAFLAAGDSDGAPEDTDLAAPAEKLGCSPFQLEFFPRAFLQPIAEELADRAHGRGAEDAGGAGSGGAAPGTAGPDGGAGAGEGARTACPVCGHRPVAGLIADEEQHENRRRLVCSLCATAWPFPRLTCPACRETEADLLGHHVAESWPHLRVEECESCGTYLKTADLREDGNALPVVDDLASIDLDLWADDRELEKIQRNVLGI